MLVGATVCWSALPASSGGTGVYVIGDSVMVGATSAVEAALAPIPVTVDAQQSRSVLGAISILQQHRDSIGDVVVVALGTNDGTDPVEFAQRIDLVMATLQGVPHVLWVNQREFAPGRDALNAQLRVAAARFPALSILDWNAVVMAHPDDVGPDGIHVTTTGAAAMGALIRQGVEAASAVQAPPATTTAPTETSPATSRAQPAHPADHAGPARLRASQGIALGRIVVATALVLVAASAIMVVRSRRRAARRRA